MQARRITCNGENDVGLSAQVSGVSVDVTLPEEIFRNCNQNLTAAQFIHESGALFPKPTAPYVETGQVIQHYSFIEQLCFFLEFLVSISS